LPCQKINMHISICICIYIYTLVLNIINYKLYYLLYITHTHIYIYHILYICMIYIIFCILYILIIYTYVYIYSIYTYYMCTCKNLYESWLGKPMACGYSMSILRNHVNHDTFGFSLEKKHICTYHMSVICHPSWSIWGVTR
jgi:hypothetical protein